MPKIFQMMFYYINQITLKKTMAQVEVSKGTVIKYRGIFNTGLKNYSGEDEDKIEDNHIYLYITEVEF